MAEVTFVPTNGFAAPPAPVPDVPGGGFAVPPAGPPARAPGAYQPNGEAIQLPGQQPGAAPKTPATPAQAQPGAAQPVDLNAVTALLQAALAGQGGTPNAATPTPGVDAVKPAWLPVSANTFDVSTVEDPIIRSMATVLQTAGKDLDLDRVLGNALAHNDVSLIDSAYLSEKGGPQAAQLAEIAKGIVQAVAAKSEALTKEVYDLVGGEAHWAQATAAFNTAAPHELRVTVAQMLDSTNANFVKAGAKIVAEFGKASGRMPQPGAPLLGNLASAGAAGGGLTKAAFQDELRKLNPNSASYEAEREALFTRRGLGKSAGLN